MEYLKKKKKKNKKNNLFHFLCRLSYLGDSGKGSRQAGYTYTDRDTDCLSEGRRHSIIPTTHHTRAMRPSWGILSRPSGLPAQEPDSGT